MLNDIHLSTLVCPITSNVHRDTSILRVNLSAEGTGLRQKSAVMIDQLRAIDNKRLIKKIGQLPENLCERVLTNVQIIIGL